MTVTEVSPHVGAGLRGAAVGRSLQIQCSCVPAPVHLGWCEREENNAELQAHDFISHDFYHSKESAQTSRAGIGYANLVGVDSG